MTGRSNFEVRGSALLLRKGGWRLKLKNSAVEQELLFVKQ
jgi:hypothetical protein